MHVLRSIVERRATSDPAFKGVDLERRIIDRAKRCGLALAGDAVVSLAHHALAVLDANERLKLTTIVDPGAFIERHIGESLEGAAMLDCDARGTLLDLGSGNGYPGLPLAVSRPGLEPALAEASTAKAEFLRDVLARTLTRGSVIETQIQRAADLVDVVPLRVLSARAVGGWERILPRLHPCLDVEGELLLWAGVAVEKVSSRTAWRRFELVERKALPGRSSSWIWRFRPA